MYFGYREFTDESNDKMEIQRLLHFQAATSNLNVFYKRNYLSDIPRYCSRKTSVHYKNKEVILNLE